MKDKKFSHFLAQGIDCHLCNAPEIFVVSGYEAFHLVTSDCRLWSKGGKLCVCPACGSVQKLIDPDWQSEMHKIYESYSIYHQGEGAEQRVFDASGQASSRSAHLLEKLRNSIKLPKTGRLLDVGCGNGALLSSFRHIAPLWSMAGTELNDKYRKDVESIEGVEALYTCAPDKIPGTFSLITMLHVLEHIPFPGKFITMLLNKLEFDGLLVVDVPDYLQNPFDLLIADHCTHFTAATATELIQSAGYEVILFASDWVPKELTIVARKTENHAKSRQQISSSLDSAVKSLRWLDAVITAARQISTKGAFGIFGTSIAATWLFGELKGSVSFFVDEDMHRAGKNYMGRPVYHPNEVPSDSHVFIAMQTRFAENIQARMKRLGYGFNCYILPIMNNDISDVELKSSSQQTGPN